MGDDTEDFVFDTFRDQPDKLPQDAAYDKFRDLVTAYGDTLAGAESRLDEAFGEVWDLNDPVSLSMVPDEDLTIEEVLGEPTADRLFYKVMLVLASLVAEAGDLVDEAKARLFPALATYGEQPEGKDIKAGDGQLTFGRMLPLFYDMQAFCKRCYAVVENMIRQLASVYSDQNRKMQERRGLAAYQAVHFTAVWRAVADVLAVLITLDEMVRQNEHFQETCTWYKRILKNVRNTPEKFDTEPRAIKRFCLQLEKLETTLLDDLIFRNCTEIIFDNPAEGIHVRDNLVLMHEFDHQLREMFTYIKRGLDMPFEIDKRNMYVGLCGLYVLYFQLYSDKVRGKAEEKKYFKSLFEVHKVVPIVHLFGATSFAPAEWLSRSIPDMANAVSKDPMKEHPAACKAALAGFELESLTAIVNRHYQNVTAWACDFESRTPVQKPSDLIGNQAKRILQGVYYVYEVSALTKMVFGTHRAMEAPLKLRQLHLLCKCVEMLKAIMGTFHRKSPVIGNLMSVMCQLLAFSLQHALIQFRNKLKENQRRLEDGQVDQLSAVELMLRILHGPPSRNSLVVLKNALSIVVSRTGGLMKPEQFDLMRQHLRRLEIVSNWQHLVREGCDCSFLYWFREIITPYFESVFKDPPTASSVRYMFSAFHDCSRVLLNVHHLEDKKALFNGFVNEIKERFHDTVVKPLSLDIENSLRLSIHSKVLGQTRHSLGPEYHKDLRQLLDIPPLRLFGERVCIRDHVEHYLAMQFYNLTAMTQRDWETYEKMRALAKERYNMDLTEAHLPGETLEQGLDLLQVMRKIPEFVSQYTYNLNNQIFVQMPSRTDSKHLTTVNVTHVANSIRTHGTGIMTTTVNFVYVFLRKKFMKFSEFLFDDHVRSRLVKDLKWFAERKYDIRNMYPVKRADKFVKDIRKRFGTVEKDVSFLDRFRKLITEIGNALAFVRLMRTGGMRCISRQISYVPMLAEIPDFASMLDEQSFRDDPDEEVEAELAETTREAAQNLDAVLRNQSKRFSDGSDYFRVLEDVFKDEMNSEKNVHLQNFYAIVPPLTLSFADHMYGCKDRLNKRKDAAFSDDGFALGVSFILKLLRMQDKFESLHWFSSVDAYFTAEKEKIDEQVDRAEKLEKEKELARKKGKGQPERSTEESGEITTLTLSRNRIKALKGEFELMFYAFRSANVFFKDKREVVAKDEEEEEDSFDEDELDEA
eukprot:TRINITY_DN9120_c0_g3_i1.p1 TRINITY_DN9120_c0_g3~~TRINITY_DN9120_c0_g3_i1.p1  ORF type:complete len:1203 (+),score=491.48 TRINITY_DN9120_c0_g3_i1:93-3701(+)